MEVERAAGWNFEDIPWNQGSKACRKDNVRPRFLDELLVSHRPSGVGARGLVDRNPVLASQGRHRVEPDLLPWRVRVSEDGNDRLAQIEESLQGPGPRLGIAEKR